MAKLLVIYHSGSGNSEAMAKAFCEGASSAGATITLKKAADATGDDLLGCDAAAFGSPVHFGYMSGALKDFFDRAFLTTRGKVDNKPYTAFSSGRRGGREALDSIDVVCSSFRLRKFFEGVVATGKPSPEVLEKCKELGKKLAQV
jgi:multimeric flavodoxin WrbA